MGGLFVDSSFGPIPGALPLSEIGLEGAATMPRPSIVVSFRTFALDPANPWQTAVQIADTTLQEGQGMHGSLGRDNTFNNMAAMGPDFRKGWVDRAPVGNADIAQTLAHVMGLRLTARGPLAGRVLHEALTGGPDAPAARRRRIVSPPSASGRSTVIESQALGTHTYLDQACLVELKPGDEVQDEPANSLCR